MDEKVALTMSAISSFRRIENKHVVYRGKNCMKTESLRKHTIKIFNFKKKKMELLTKEKR